MLENAARYPKHPRINDNLIYLINRQKRLYELIYIRELIELKTLKTYNNINLANNSIQASKLPTKVLILFVCKPDDSFRSYINY